MMSFFCFSWLSESLLPFPTHGAAIFIDLFNSIVSRYDVYSSYLVDSFCLMPL